jgi:AcrR family transcriptional regulator
MQPRNQIKPADPSRLRLVDAATRLFAQHGIDSVALKDIVAAAGQKNQSAVQYHFGGKQGLIAAALEARFRGIDARRIAMVNAAKCMAGSLRRAAIMRATVEPIVAEAEGHADGPAYIRFVVQAVQRPDFDAAAVITGRAYPGLQALSAAIAHERGAPAPAHREYEQRIRICAKLTIAGVADWVANEFGPMKREALIVSLARANEAILLG